MTSIIVLPTYDSTQWREPSTIVNSRKYLRYRKVNYIVEYLSLNLQLSWWISYLDYYTVCFTIVYSRRQSSVCNSKYGLNAPRTYFNLVNEAFHNETVCVTIIQQQPISLFHNKLQPNKGRKIFVECVLQLIPLNTDNKPYD